MKTLKLFILIIVLFAFGSCKELFVTTKVNKDGSFTRIITITGDSAEILNSGTPYPIDLTWEKHFSKDTADSTKYMLTYTKLFQNSEMLNADIAGDTSWMKQIRRNPEVTRKFGFFYSYLTFRETYSAFNPFTNLDYKDYLTEEDLAWLSGNKKSYTHADSLKLQLAEDKQENFMLESLTKEIIDGLKTGIAQLNDPSLPPGAVDLVADSIRNEVIQGDFSLDTTLLNRFQVWTGNASVAKLKALDPPVLLAYNQSMEKLELLFDFEGFKQIVEMPGIITETNSTSLKGNQVSWEVSADAFLFTDQVMKVESRVVNYWAFILAGIFGLALIMLILFKGFRK